MALEDIAEQKSLAKDFKELNWLQRMAVIGATLIGLASATYGAYTLKNNHKIHSEQYEHKCNSINPERQNSEYTISFSTPRAEMLFAKFVANYIEDHKQELSGRDYLNPKERWQLSKLVSENKYGNNSITEGCMENAFRKYATNKKMYALQQASHFSDDPHNEYEILDKEYKCLEAEQDRLIKIYKDRIKMHQERINYIRAIADNIRY
ncbi:MAG: hypothetical protein QW165_03740 [Candidatus Woesearchaeota archaeon]